MMPWFLQRAVCKKKKTVYILKYFLLRQNRCVKRVTTIAAVTDFWRTHFCLNKWRLIGSRTPEQTPISGQTATCCRPLKHEAIGTSKQAQDQGVDRFLYAVTSVSHEKVKREETFWTTLVHSNLSKFFFSIIYAMVAVKGVTNVVPISQKYCFT